MLWMKAWHIIFVVTWFAGLFYLPRLFVYHAALLEHPPHDVIGHERFCIMERKLFWGIMTPSAILALLFGVLVWGSYGFMAFKGQAWLHAKLLLVACLIGYHFMCLKYLRQFKKQQNRHSSRYYRWFNEVTVLILIAIVILVVVKPF